MWIGHFIAAALHLDGYIFLGLFSLLLELLPYDYDNNDWNYYTWSYKRIRLSLFLLHNSLKKITYKDKIYAFNLIFDNNLRSILLFPLLSINLYC